MMKPDACHELEGLVEERGARITPVPFAIFANDGSWRTARAH